MLKLLNSSNKSLLELNRFYSYRKELLMSNIVFVNNTDLTEIPIVLTHADGRQESYTISFKLIENTDPFLNENDSSKNDIADHDCGSECDCGRYK